MGSTYSFIRTLLLSVLMVSFLGFHIGVIGGCGGGGNNNTTNDSDDSSDDSDSEDEENTEITDTDLLQDETALTCSGQVSASLSSGSASATIPSGQLDSCANASPTMALTTAASSTLSESETDISDDGDSVQVDLNSDFGITATPSENGGNDITMTLAYDDSEVTGSTEDSLHIYVLAADQDTGAVVPLVGDLNTANNTITVSTKGLPANTIFTVVYNANVVAIASDDSSISALQVSSFPQQKSLTASTWPTNVWCVIYDPTNATLKSVVANILSVPEASLTAQQIRTVVADRVARNARVSGNDYQTLGFRAPHLYAQSSNAATRACSGTNQSVYFVHMVYGNGSYFQPDDPTENADTDTLAGFGTKFGRLYVDADRLDDASATGLGTVEASVAHEMFHAIQTGYEMYRSGEKVYGIAEGTAATIGKTLDGDGTTTSTPLVRDFASETYTLAGYLLIHSPAFRYSNQDFFAYVARQYNIDSFDYLPSYFAAHRNRVNALTTAASITAPSYSLLYAGLEEGLQDGISSDLTLPEVYFDFAVNRLVEHNSDSQFGRSGETTAAGTLATNLLSGNLGLLVSLRGEADSLSVSKTSNRIGSYSTRVFRVIPSKASDNENGVKLSVTVSPSRGDIGSEVRVKYYRAGSGSGTEVSSETFEIRNWGKTTSDQIIVVVSNAQAALGVTFTYEASTEPEEESEENSVSVTIEIDGDTINFDPNLILGGFGNFNGGDVQRTNLPGWTATEGTTVAAATTSASLTILTDPDDIGSSGGSFNIRDVGEVFEDGIGSATVTFHTPTIRDEDSGDIVVFNGSSGTMTFTSYSESVGGRLTGSFNANVSGNKTIIDGEGEEQVLTLTGTIEGEFNVELVQQ